MTDDDAKLALREHIRALPDDDARLRAAQVASDCLASLRVHNNLGDSQANGLASVDRAFRASVGEEIARLRIEESAIADGHGDARVRRMLGAQCEQLDAMLTAWKHAMRVFGVGGATEVGT